MELVTNWIRALVGAAVFCALATALCPEGRPKRVLRAACGVVMAAARARELSGLSPALFTPVVKCVGIGIVCALGSEACRDAGSSQLASAVELAGAAAALVCALPLISALLDTVEGLV